MEIFETFLDRYTHAIPVEFMHHHVTAIIETKRGAKF